MWYRDSNRASKILMQWRKIWASSSIVGCLCGHYKRWRGNCKRGYHGINRFCVGVKKCVVTEAWFDFVVFTKTSEVAKKINSALELSNPPKARNISYLQRSTTEASFIDGSSIHCIFQRGRTLGKFRGNVSADSVAWMTNSLNVSHDESSPNEMRMHANPHAGCRSRCFSIPSTHGSELHPVIFLRSSIEKFLISGFLRALMRSKAMSAFVRAVFSRFISGAVRSNSSAS